MSCYLGETETTADTVSFSAPLETPWDDGTGTSALTELCRMVNNRLVALHQTAHTFTSVGLLAADGAFVARAYASNPARHPIYEFANVLSECKAQVYLMLNPQITTPTISFGGMVNASGYRWRYNNAATVKATLDGALSGLLATLVEDWKPMIVALRAALESLSGAVIQSKAWDAATISITGPFSGSTSLQVYENTAIDPASVTPAIGGTSTHWHIDVSPGANLYGDRVISTPGTNDLPGRGDIAVGFQSDYGNDYPADDESIDYLGASSTFYLAEPVGYVGWVHTRSCRKTFSFACSGSAGVDLRKLNGKVISWHLDTVDSGDSTRPPTDFPVTYSNPSGSITWSGNSAGFSSTKTVVSDVTLDDPAIPITEDAVDWWQQRECRDVQLYIDTPVFNFCIDSNGDTHDD